MSARQGKTRAGPGELRWGQTRGGLDRPLWSRLLRCSTFFFFCRLWARICIWKVSTIGLSDLVYSGIRLFFFAASDEGDKGASSSYNFHLSPYGVYLLIESVYDVWDNVQFLLWSNGYHSSCWQKIQLWNLGVMSLVLIGVRAKKCCKCLHCVLSVVQTV